MLCRQCAGKKRRGSAAYVGPSKLKDLSNVDYSDFTIHKTKTSTYRRYKMACVHCGDDRGYKRLEQHDKRCESCRRKALTKHTPLQFRIRENMRHILKLYIKKHGVLKQRAMAELLGYTPKELIKDFQSKFMPGMSWDNYGEWHIDHKIPDSWFNYDSTDSEAFRKCWSLDNLQPKWAYENICTKKALYADINGHNYTSEELKKSFPDLATFLK